MVRLLLYLGESWSSIALSSNCYTWPFPWLLLLLLLPSSTKCMQFFAVRERATERAVSGCGRVFGAVTHWSALSTVRMRSASEWWPSRLNVTAMAPSTVGGTYRNGKHADRWRLGTVLYACTTRISFGSVPYSNDIAMDGQRRRCWARRLEDWWYTVLCL